MIRRDYILRMLADFFEVLSRIRGLQNSQLWDHARQLTDEEFQRLVGMNGSEIAKLSETELLARIIQGETTLAVTEKTLIVATLLKEAGDIAEGQENCVGSRSHYLKGLDLLLGVLAREDTLEFPEFVPRVEGFLQGLRDGSLPLTTQAKLMHHYERTGEFGKAEDMLFSMLDDAPTNSDLIGLGVAFYHRLQIKSDDELTLGNLPRSELEAGLAQLQARNAESSRPVIGSSS